jgi:hypothetical protein
MRCTHELLRLARRIHAAYEQRAAQSLLERQTDWSHLEECILHVQQQRRLMEKARSCGWHLAAEKHGQHLPAVLRACSEAMREMQDRLLEPPYQPPRLVDLLAELQNVELEFDEVIIDKKNFLAVQTEAIVLEEIDLGRFSIKLHWSRLAQQISADCFEIVPIDPHPASSNEDVPHPHVRSRHLCAGEATLPLQKALEQGRLTDAFHLIRSVLETYNAASAYVALDDWEGMSCWNCGATASEDDRYFCESCDHDVCYDCTSFCKKCDNVRCSSCQTRCEVCNEACCPRCLKTSACSELSCCEDCLRVCTVCSAEVASSELDEATERCPTCQDAITEADVPESDALIPATSSDGEMS